MADETLRDSEIASNHADPAAVREQLGKCLADHPEGSEVPVPRDVVTRAITLLGGGGPQPSEADGRGGADAGGNRFFSP